MADRTSRGFPDGLKEENVGGARGFARRASPLSLALLGGLMVLAFTGLLGGVEKSTLAVEGSAARLEVRTPTVIRNGEFFETRIRVVPRRAIEELAIGVTPPLWRDMTINTMIPAPAEESHEGGVFRFSFGPAEAGEPLELKIDGQINPALFGGTQGQVIVYDGDAIIARTEVRVKVLP